MDIHNATICFKRKYTICCRHQDVQRQLHPHFKHISNVKMCIHQCYNFRCGHKFFVPGALIVCDSATVALLIPPSGKLTEEGSKTLRDLENPEDQEAAEVTLPQSPPPRYENEEGAIRTEWRKIQNFSGVCTPKPHGLKNYNIDRLCSACGHVSDEGMEVAQIQLAEARRRAELFSKPEDDADARSTNSGFEADTKSTKSPDSNKPRRASSVFLGSFSVFKRPSRDN